MLDFVKNIHNLFVASVIFSNPRGFGLKSGKWKNKVSNKTPVVYVTVDGSKKKV